MYPVRGRAPDDLISLDGQPGFRRQGFIRTLPRRPTDPQARSANRIAASVSWEGLACAQSARTPSINLAPMPRHEEAAAMGEACGEPHRFFVSAMRILETVHPVAPGATSVTRMAQHCCRNRSHSWRFRTVWRRGCIARGSRSSPPIASPAQPVEGGRSQGRSETSDSRFRRRHTGLPEPTMSLRSAARLAYAERRLIDGDDGIGTWLATVEHIDIATFDHAGEIRARRHPYRPPPDRSPTTSSRRVGAYATARRHVVCVDIDAPGPPASAGQHFEIAIAVDVGDVDRLNGHQLAGWRWSTPA